MVASPPRLVVVSARSPFSSSAAGITRSPGGVISALLPLLRRKRGIWFATGADAGASAEAEDGFEVRPVDLEASTRAAWYSGASNGAIWPLAHAFIERCRFAEKDWAAYVEVCRKVADSVAAAAGPNALVWVHDYQLALVPALLRELRADLRIGFFWHIPWPPAELLRIAPWADRLVRGILGADLVGFHLDRYVGAFAGGLEAAGISFEERSPGSIDVRIGGRTRRIVACPIGVDDASWAELGADSGVAARAAALRRASRKRILLAVDRLDYSKGCVERLEAYERAIERCPALLDSATLIQIGVPSRETIGDYRDLRGRIEATVGRINGRFSNASRTPARFFATCLPPNDLAAYYSAADVALVTPLRDGMNLVASEYVATRRGKGGRLVLSTTAGAADLLIEAHRVNPYDRDAFAATIAALATTPETSVDRARMATLAERVRAGNVHAWVDRFLGDLARGESDIEGARSSEPRAAGNGEVAVFRRGRATKAPPSTGGVTPPLKRAG